MQTLVHSFISGNNHVPSPSLLLPLRPRQDPFPPTPLLRRTAKPSNIDRRSPRDLRDVVSATGGRSGTGESVFTVDTESPLTPIPTFPSLPNAPQGRPFPRHDLFMCISFVMPSCPSSALSASELAIWWGEMKCHTASREKLTRIFVPAACVEAPRVRL